VTEPVSVVGLGKLGLPLACCFATKLQTIGVDVNAEVVSAVNDGRAPWSEPRLGELLAAHGGRSLRATLDHREAIEATGITFVLVPTPSNPDGGFSNAILLQALTSLAEALGGSRKPSHLFVVSSTVMPGTIERELVPAIESASGRKAGDGFEVCYDPDFVALGETVKGFFNPELIIIGETNEAAGERVARVHRAVCQNTPHIARMSIASAEVAKVALNAYITLKITFANHLANICERVPGADVDAITQAVGTDSRISRKYFTGGMAFGGTCFPRDTFAFKKLSTSVGVGSPLMEATEEINDLQTARLVEVVRACRTGGGAVGVAGVAFRRDTPVITGSPAVELIERLLADDVRVIAFDPLAHEVARVKFGNAIEYAASLEDCLADSEVVAVTHRSREFKHTLEAYVSDHPITIVDCWRLLDPGRVAAPMRVRALGRWSEPCQSRT
jgi:UDPglucose 6-dehydrogenase